MNKNQSTGIVIVVAIILIVLLSVAFDGPQTSTSEIPYTQFLNKVKMGSVEKVEIARDVLIAIPKEDSSEVKKQDLQTTNPLN